MPRTITLIDDFSVGEVSPLTEAQISSDEFRDGLRECTNIVPDSHGPMIGRSGFEQKKQLTLPAQAKSATLFTISYSPEEFFIVLLYHLKIEVYDQDAKQLFSAATLFTDEILHGPNGDEHLSQSFINPGGKELVILTGNIEPYLVTMTAPANSQSPWTVTFAAITWTAGYKPSQWAAGNYPTTGTYYQGRTWWAGCENHPDHFWASKSDDPYDLSYGATPADTDGIEFQISKHGRIRWLQAGRQLLIGTEAAEHIATAEAGVLTPSDIHVELQSAFGSKRLQSVLIGNEVVYVTSDSRKLRSMWWKWVEAGWVSLDATFTAEHLTRDGVSQIAFARNPYSNVWCLLKSGDLVANSYRREKDQDPIVGWFRISSDAMEFKAITTCENLGTSDLWAVVKSKADGENAYHLVASAPVDYADDDAIYIDDYVVKNYGTPTDTADFSDMFFDVPLTVIADGFHIPEAIWSNGVVTLPIKASKIIVGYQYTQRIETMPLIKVSKEGGGIASTHQMKRWNKVYLRMIRSYMPTVNGERPPERNVSTPDDTPEPYIDSFVQITPGLGWDRDAILTIEQELPFRMIVTGIYGEVGIENI